MSWPFRSWGRGALMAHEEVAMQPVAIVFALADVPQGRREPKFVRKILQPEPCPCVDHYIRRLSTSLTKKL